MRILWTRLALGDLAHVHDYIAQENPTAAAGVIERIEKSVAMLFQHSQMGRFGRVEGSRELVVSGTPFIISYRVKPRAIEILAVIHSARRWPDVF